MNAFGWALAAGMLITGSINTLSTKAADLQTAQNRYGNTVYFNHPFVQAVGMFIGEFSCLLAYTFFSWRAASRGDESFKRAKPHSKLIFLIPALCDMCATSIMYVGLSLTSSSIFQMLRGSVVIFTATFSAVFLKKKQAGFKWVGVAFVMVGTAVVGASSFVSSCKDTCAGSGGTGSDSKAMVGNVLIIVAQVIVASQMVVEEMFIEGYDIPPLQVVGWEGTWGLSIMSVVLLAMYYIPTQGTPMCSFNFGPNATVVSNSTCPTPDIEYSSEAVCSHVEDTYDAFVQFGNNGKIVLFTALNVCSIAFFNFFGVSVTKYVNSATRMVLDSLRTMVIWGFSLGIGWEKFCWVQVVGFVLLLTGTFIFNALIKVPGFSYEDSPPLAPSQDEAQAALLADASDNDTSSINMEASQVGAYNIRSIKQVK